MTDSRVGWPRLKIRLAIAFLLFATASPYLIFYSDLLRRLPPAQSGISLPTRLQTVAEWTPAAGFLRQLENGRKVLPSRGTVGFIYDKRPALPAYYLSQYTLSPLIVRSDANAKLVLCYFHSTRSLANARRTRKLTRWFEMDFKNSLKLPDGWKPRLRQVSPSQALMLRHDFGRGLVLFERVSTQQMTPTNGRDLNGRGAR